MFPIDGRRIVLDKHHPMGLDVEFSDDACSDVAATAADGHPAFRYIRYDHNHRF